MILVALAGVHAYFALGQSEDPPFAVRTMVVRAYLPGATIDETMRELTDRIEKKLEEAPYLDLSEKLHHTRRNDNFRQPPVRHARVRAAGVLVPGQEKSRGYLLHSPVRDGRPLLR